MIKINSLIFYIKNKNMREIIYSHKTKEIHILFINNYKSIIYYFN